MGLLIKGVNAKMRLHFVIRMCLSILNTVVKMKTIIS